MSKHTVDKQTLAVASAIIIALGFYWLAAKLTVTKDADQTNSGTGEAAIVSEIQVEDILGKPRSREATVEEIYKSQRTIKKMMDEIRKSQVKSPGGHRLIFYEYPDGHPYGRTPETDIIIKTPQPLSGKSFSGMDRDLQIKLEENAGARRDSGNK
jgi:hypothetical protein